MPRLASKLLLGLCVLALGSSVAQADQRKPNFFDLLFGSHPRQTGNTAFHRPWWDQPQPGSAAYANAQLIAGSDSADPEFQLPGLGMGTIDYVPPLATPIYDLAFLNIQTTSPEADAIRKLLADKATPIKAVEAERKAINAFYKTGGFKPVWFDGGHLTSKAADVLKVLAAAADDGMDAKNYLPEVLASFDNADQLVAGDSAKQARLEVGLTQAALHFARQISGGQFEPNRLSLYNDIHPEAVNADEALKNLTASATPDAYLRDLAPKHPQYALLRAELAKLSAGQVAVIEPIAAGPVVKPGKSDPRIPALRTRLVQLGFVGQADSEPVVGDKLDQDLTIGLMAFQTANKMKPSGALDAGTLKVLNRDATVDHREQLLTSMERLRWLPKNLGERFVFVNQAAYDVHVMDHDKPIWISRVIVGQPTKQTYSFYDQIQTVVFNPKWGVPASIIINEYGPKMRKDPGYLDRNGFVVTDIGGNEISSSSVDWWHIGRNPNFGVQQLAGGGNALGELKFLFPNAHDIYMHDTPTKNLFKDPVRAFSHGCVRVQNPREFAEVLLGWKKEQVANSIAIPDTHSVQLTQKVPVYLTYFTAWADETGRIQYFDDVYGRDAAMAKAMHYDPNAKPTTPVLAQGTISGGIIQN